MPEEHFLNFISDNTKKLMQIAARAGQYIKTTTTKKLKPAAQNGQNLTASKRKKFYSTVCSQFL